MEGGTWLWPVQIWNFAMCKIRKGGTHNMTTRKILCTVTTPVARDVCVAAGTHPEFMWFGNYIIH